VRVWAFFWKQCAQRIHTEGNQHNWIADGDRSYLHSILCRLPAVISRITITDQMICFYRAPFRDRAPLIPHDSQHSEQNTTLPAAPWRFYVLSC
jgi:hypothetical protein